MNAGKNTFCFFLKILPSRQSPRESFFAERKERFQILFLKALFRVKRPFTPSSFCTKGSTPFHISSVSLLKLFRYKPGCFVCLRKLDIIYSYHIKLILFFPLRYLGVTGRTAQFQNNRVTRCTLTARRGLSACAFRR